jgi:hypothetical protein
VLGPPWTNPAAQKNDHRFTTAHSPDLAFGRSGTQKLTDRGQEGRGEGGKPVHDSLRHGTWRGGQATATVVELIGGGAPAQRGEEEGGVGCSGGRAMILPFYRVRRGWRWPGKVVRWY